VNYVSYSWEMSEGYSYDYIDLHDLAWKLSKYLPPGAAKSYASDIMSDVNATVFANAHWDAIGGESILRPMGVTIYFPEVGYYDSSYGSVGLDFAAETTWDEFLVAYYARLQSPNNAPSISTWSPTGDVTMDEGEDQAFSVSASDPDGNALSYLWYLDGAIIAEGGSSIVFTPGYDDSGPHVLEVQIWDGDLWVTQSWNVDVNNVDVVDPTSQLNSISPYWYTSGSKLLSATASDPDGTVDHVTLFYRASVDNSSWSSWTDFGTDMASPWEWSFDFPMGNGYYQFYSIAVDSTSLEEDAPSAADAVCAFDGSAPSALFTPSPSVGDTVTVFQVDASACADLKDPDSELEYRWDWNNDGIWETGWISNEISTHVYSLPGDYTIVLQVRDSDGMVNSTTHTVHVDTEIPEFGTIVLPILGCLMLVVAVTRTRSRRT
jgi:hypothetical protein